MGDHQAALPLSRRALAVRLDAYGAGHPSLADSLNGLALLHEDMGHHKAALPILQQALAIRKASQGEKTAEYATALNNLGRVHHGMGDSKAALLLFREALRRYDDSLGKGHRFRAICYNNIAQVLVALGDHKEARLNLELALAINKATVGERHPGYANCLNNLGLLHDSLGQHEAALPLLSRARDLWRDLLGETHPLHAASLHNLAGVHKDMGHHEDAIRLYRQASALQKDALGDTHPAQARTLNNLAAVFAASGDDANALVASERAMTLTLARLRDLASVQSDRQQFAAAALLRQHLDVRLSIPDAPRHTPAAAYSLAWKGALLARQQERRLFLSLTSDEATRGAAERLQSVTRQLVALRLSPGATREKAEAMEREQDDAQADLARRSDAFRSRRSAGPTTPERLAASLPDGAALVDFLFFRRHGLKGAGGKPRVEAQLAAFVTRPGRPAVRVDLGTAAGVEEAVLAWRALLLVRRPDAAAGARLKALVWSPLEKHLAGAKVVLIGTDGVLGTVPFAALPGKKEGAYLIEELAVAAAPLPSAIPDLMTPRPEAARLPPSLLVAGDLRYEPGEGDRPARAGTDTPTAARTGRESFARLPATAAEADDVRASFQGLFKGGSVTPFKGASATKAAVRKALSSVRYAHLATHGFFAPEAVKSAVGEREGTGWHPLLLSGLALSDANRAPKSGEEDGILTALEVAEMDLSGLELAVLSACETGLGKVAGGEGVLGMQRAFQAAGCRSVVSSLWSVDDRATRDLMAAFYRGRWDAKSPLPAIEALRRAQLAMLRADPRMIADGVRRGMVREDDVKAGTARVPPFYWAAFVLSGDWR